MAFTVNKPSGVLFDPVIGLVEKLSVYYLRPMERTYTVTLTVEDSAGLKATATKEIVVSTGDLSGDVDAIKALLLRFIQITFIQTLTIALVKVSSMNGSLLAKTLPYLIAKIILVTYATDFIPFARFEGGEALQDFTISFKYTTLNEVWKLCLVLDR